MKQPSSQRREAAEMLAIQALSFIAAEPEQLAAFLSVTGLSVEGLRAAARQPDFLGGVLEHMLGDERLLIAFADSAGIKPAEVSRARHTLAPQWERDVP